MNIMRKRRAAIEWPPFPVQPLSLAEVRPLCELPGCRRPARRGYRGKQLRFCSTYCQYEAQSKALDGRPFGEGYAGGR